MLAADTAVSTGGVTMVARDQDKITPLLLDDNNIAIAATGDPADTDRLTLQLVATSRRKTYEVGPIVERLDCSTKKNRRRVVSPSATSYDVERVAAAARTAIVQRMRSRHPYRVSLLIAGMGEAAASYDDTGSSTAIIAVNHALQQQLERATSQGRQHSERRRDEEDRRSEKKLASSDLVEQDTANAPPTSTSTTTTTTSSPSAAPLLFWLDEYGAMQQVPYAVHGHASTLVWSLLDRGWRPDMTREEAQALLDSCLRLLEQRFLINTSSSQFCIKCIDCTGCTRVDVQ